MVACKGCVVQLRKKKEKKDRKEVPLTKKRERENKITSVWEEGRADLRTFDLGFKRKFTFPLLGGKQWQPVRGNDRCRNVPCME